MKPAKLNRVFHRWASMIIAAPLLVVIFTGIILQLKKEFVWIQPATQKGNSKELSLPFDRILEIAKSVPEAEIENWADIDRLDVRPSKGMLKIRAVNRHEIQLDTQTGDILQVAYRRSDFIESIHDGSFFHEKVKLWIFLPSAVILFGLWITGIYLFIMPYQAKRRRQKKVEIGDA